MADIDAQPKVKLVAQCRRCHGWLVTPESVAHRIGPTCAMRERAEQRAAAAVQTAELTLFEIAA
ncbi:DUF6011 domain-containing protein [Rhodococcus erythropolis]